MSPVNIWRNISAFIIIIIIIITDHCLLYQKTQIIRKKQLIDLELEEIKRMIEHEESGVVGDIADEHRNEYDGQEREINENENDHNVNEKMNMGSMEY